MGSMEKILEGLNSAQAEAVCHREGPLLLVAGAGTGKTTVITRRLAKLIQDGLATPDQVLALTFTDKAAGEMEERIDALLPYGYTDLWVSTFHSFGERLLHEYGLDIGLPHEFKLLNQTDQWLLLREHIEELGLDYYRPKGNPTKFVEALSHHFSRLKDEMITPEQYIEYAEKLCLNLDVEQAKTKDLDEEKRVQVDEAIRIRELARAYHVYQQLLLQENALDFGDLIFHTVQLLKQRPAILHKLRQQFRFIMVDEFQDTNLAQYELIKLIASPKNNLVAVGDDDQSIFKWRGASVSNILHFQKDFPTLKQIVLTENYRSGQPILDLAYQFIQQNNPDRLESKLQIQKRLVAKSGREGKVFHLRRTTGEGEAHTIVRKIAELKQEHPDWTWSDFAVLVRANDHAENILPLLERASIPYQYVASTGLFLKPLMLDILSYLRVVENVHNNLALYRVLTMPMWKLAPEDVMAVLNYTARKPLSMLDTLKNCRAIGGLSVPGCTTIERLLSLMAQHAQLVREKHAGEAVLKIVQNIGLMKWMTDQEEAKAAQHLVLLNQLFQLIASFEKSAEDKRVKYFLHNVDLMLEAGDAGALKVDIDEGPESVKVMTVHASKGLEFQAVFVVNMVDKRFPSVGRSEPISIPDDLLNEILPTGDAHLQEERRLFYVACTRAKQYLFLTSAEDYGGARKKKPSRFLVECGLAEVKAEPTGVVAFESQDQAIPAERAVVLSNSSDTFSFSQFEAYERCPWQYRYRFVLKVPAPGNYSASFGRSVHDTLLEFFKRVRSNTEAAQGTLFGPAEKPLLPTDRDLLKIFEDKWQSDWYATPKAEQEYKEAGKNALKEFYRMHHQAWPKVKYLEKGFSLRLKDVTVKGKIDRVDGVGESKTQVNVVDYKTGRYKEKKDFNQLFIYAMAIQDVFKEEPQQVGYYFIEENKTLDKPVTPQALEKTRDWVLDMAGQILSGDFTASPGPQCQFCDYRSICEFRAV